MSTAAAPAVTDARGWWRLWGAVVAQLAALSLIVLTGAITIDVRQGQAAADLAAERGVGPVVSLPRAAPAHAAPTAIVVRRVGIRSSLAQLRKNPDGTVQVPDDAKQAGWYVGSSHPGDPGPTVIIGHVDSYKGPGIFLRLDDLRKGDLITVYRSDRTHQDFLVTTVMKVPKRKFPTALVYQGDGKASLRLVTCGGRFNRRAGHYLDNTIVLAVPAPVKAANPRVRKAPASPRR